MGLGDRITELLGEAVFVPAPAQGILALQCRDEDARIEALLKPLTDRTTAIRAAAERAFLVRLGASCTVPVGCHAVLETPDVLTVAGLIVDPSGEPCFMSTKVGHPRDAASLGARLAEELLALGADQVADLAETSRRAAP